jgi:hypothetical protein
LATSVRKAVTAAEPAFDALDELIKENENLAPGNKDFQAAIGFSFRRTEEDLGLQEDSFVWPEARWQQMMRAGGTEKVWEEPAVLSPDNQETYPYPGKEAWTLWEAYRTYTMLNFDMALGRAKARESMTEQAGDSDRVNLSDSYLTNAR